MDEREPFGPDEPLAYGQVWRYRNGFDATVMVLVPGEFTTTLHLAVSWSALGKIDETGWASLRDHLPEYWERLA